MFKRSKYKRTSTSKLPPNRTRNAQISCRATEAEKTRWTKACKDSGLSTIQLMMRLLVGRLIIIVGLKPLADELRRQGINLNQAVKHAHQYAPKAEAGLQFAAQKCVELYIKIEKFLDQIHLNEGKDDDICHL